MDGGNRTWIGIGIIILLAALAPGDAGSEGKCGEIDGHFRGRFWHFYLRGNSYAECKMWPEAESDFQEAIKQREADQIMAKTYGLNFIDYFPHRELGIVFFRQGKNQEALAELEQSHQAAPSARAAYYLNEVNRLLLKQAGGDSAAPVISISSPAANSITSDFKIKVRGEVRDPGRVERIMVGGQAVVFDLAEERKGFTAEVELKRGRQTIPITAGDLMGNEARYDLMITVDREGPQIIIESVSEAAGILSVKGTVVDPSGVKSLNFGKRSASIKPGPEVSFEEKLSATERRFEAHDLGGNKTHGEIAAGPPLKKGGWLEPKTRWAFLGDPPPPRRALWEDGWYLAQAGGPTIEIKGLEPEQTVYLDRVVIEGAVKSDKSITELKVQDETILQRPGTTVYFSKLLALNDGGNEIRISVQDQDQRRADQKLRINRVIPKVHDVGSRFRISLMPLAGGQDQTRADVIQSKLLHHLSQRKRFSLVEREKIEAVLTELKLSQESLVDPSSAVEVGKLVSAEGMIFGEVHETENSLEVVARLVNVETGEIMLSLDAYTEDLEMKSLDELSERLSWKFIAAYPLGEGSVIKVSGSELFIDTGKAAGWFSPMPLIVFEMGEEIINPATGESLGADTREIGAAVLTSVEDKFSKAEAAPGAAVATGMKVITR